MESWRERWCGLRGELGLRQLDIGTPRCHGLMVKELGKVDVKNLGKKTDVEEREISLRGGTRPGEGNVYVQGRPICDDGWDFLDASVTCR